MNADRPRDGESAAGAAAAELDSGTYEVLRARLHGQAAELGRRCAQLNERRSAEFGTIEFTLLGPGQIHTEQPATARDLAALPDGRMVVGYDVISAVKPDTEIGDIFAVHRLRRAGPEIAIGPGEPANIVDAPGFRSDFAELYRYYDRPRLLRLRRPAGRLLAVFRIGRNAADIKVLRWRVTDSEAPQYLDNRGERDHTFPAADEIAWIETTRDDQIPGRPPRLSIRDRVLVSTAGGTLTVTPANAADSYTEPVDDPLQSLADADIHYAEVGALILLRIRPYNESTRRYFVVDTRTGTVVRLDGIGQSCRLLPDDQGIIFPGGYFLGTGVHKTFDLPVADLEYEQTVRAPNGEDVLYVFRARTGGDTLLLPYNVITEQITTPITCHGYALFDDGTLVLLRTLSGEPTRVHPVQIWRTPFVSDVHAATRPAGSGPLARIGNAELVRGLADCLSVTRMVDELSPAAAVFEALIAGCTRVTDQHHWIDDPALGGIADPLTALRDTAVQMLEEYEKVAARTREAAAAVADAAESIAGLVRAARSAAGTTAEDWVDRLTGLRRALGQLETLRALRYVDSERIDELTTTVTDTLTETGHRAVEFFSGDRVFDDYHAELEAELGRAEDIGTVAAAEPIRQGLIERTDGLRTVVEIVSGLDIADATVRTRILERIGTVLAAVNRARAALEARRGELAAVEGRAEFTAEFALLTQSVTGALAFADTPEVCDDQLAKLLVTVENLEARFGAFDDFAEQLATERENVYEAFAARKQALLDERSQRSARLFDSAQRVLSGIERRCATSTSLDEVNTYFGSDPMVARLRTIAGELRAAGEGVRATELDSRLRAARQEAGRALRDRLDLYTDGGETILLGRHRFAVHTRQPDLALVPHDGSIAFTITGTDYRAPVRDTDFFDTEPFWSQLLVSETEQMYRAEYLAISLLAEAEENGTVAVLEQAQADEGELRELVHRSAEQRYDEGYQAGVHDHDATAILSALLRLRREAGLLRFRPADRAAAQLWWSFGGPRWQSPDAASRERWTVRIRSMARARALFADSTARGAVLDELATAIGEFAARLELGDIVPALAAEYLFEEISGDTEGFVTARAARDCLGGFHRRLAGHHAEYRDDLRSLAGDIPVQRQLVTTWLSAYLSGSTDSEAVTHLPEAVTFLPEAVALELCGPDLPRYESDVELTATVTGLLGDHPRITHRTLDIRLDELIARGHRFRTERVPGFRRYLHRRNELVEAERRRLRLREYRPAVLSGFVRSRLLDEVYLPLIGDNLAEQIGAAGDDRTDRSGLLLLISPPGYGKTTLIEYVAARLGLILVKVNGPALGTGVRSLDPAEAPDATARTEVEKINFALELGDNVLLYLDDIQHTSPELLQKFISLCDAQRRMEGVWEGRTRTYDLRGKRFAVCMAGNPYTEQGRRFRIPDMLANRADVWNLGDVLAGRDDLFALSYLENSLTANPVLAPLSTGARGDLEVLVRIARGDDTAHTDQLTGSWPAPELTDIVAVLRKVLRIQAVLTAVNRAYISSAATHDADRSKPPFQLQGSYRNMNALVERVVPVMNEEELETLIDDHYTAEAQTLAGRAEANLLELAELRGRLTPETAARWSDIQAAYVRERALGSNDDDPLIRAVGGLGLLADRLGTIAAAIHTLESGR